MLRILLICTVFIVIGCSESQDSKYARAVHQLVLSEKNQDAYNNLLKPVGLEVNHEYTYTEYSNIKRANDIGTAGHYDFLLFSTGGNQWDYEATEKFNLPDCAWETTYYGNHDLTILHEECRDARRSSTTVRVLKVSKGRQQNLHAE